MPDLGSDITEVGGAIGSLFTAQGNAAQAKDFQGAATLATQNAQLAMASTKIQATQTARTVAQSLGSSTADVAGAGFTTSGSALDILKESASQGALAKSLVNIQGAINENSYAAQAGAYQGEANAAKEASTAGTIGAIASIGGGLISGTNQLASAGNTVIKGYNYVNENILGNPPSSFTDASDAEVNDFLASNTDTGVTSGATDLTENTSSLAVGTTQAEASTEAAEAATNAAGGVSAAGGAEEVSEDVGEEAVEEDIGEEGVEDVGEEAAADEGGADILGAIGDGIEAVFSTVLCTALYKQGLVSRAVWVAAQRYGQCYTNDAAGVRLFVSYLFWATPIANLVTKHLWFAKLVAPIFIPSLHEEAVRMGLDVKRSTYGKISFKILYVFTWTLSRMMTKTKRWSILTN